ncbi:hypothetical protein OXYTRIMIC_653 [Oxytricha trifallax]|uniref:Uncharacterized protein n=1 Tax=Oxytricha trifallax TaxID=1172189 RepID=A0A073IB43_9SPIT|nr:hypothetical protein OXYTRIMIC_653 [Oxytricha trifallax]
MGRNKKQNKFYQNLSKSNNPTIYDTIMVALIRSLIIYKYTPLVATRCIKIEEIDKIELQQKRLAFKTQRDINNEILRNVTQLKENGTREIIEQLVFKNMKKVNSNLDIFIISNKAKDEVHQSKQDLGKKKKLFITKNVMDTMMEISQGRTVVSYGMRYHCNVQQTFVNTQHLKNCNLMNGAGDPQRFSQVVRNHRLIYLDSKTQIEVIANMIWLDIRIRGLEANGYYQKVKKLFKITYVKKTTNKNS